MGEDQKDAEFGVGFESAKKGSEFLCRFRSKIGELTSQTRAKMTWLILQRCPSSPESCTDDVLCDPPEQFEPFWMALKPSPDRLKALSRVKRAACFCSVGWLMNEPSSVAQLLAFTSYFWFVYVVMCAYINLSRRIDVSQIVQKDLMCSRSEDLSSQDPDKIEHEIG